jgi:hypothetical protein
MQSAVNTIEEEVFSMWFSYIHCWITDVFSTGPPRDYISGTKPNQGRGGGEETQRVLGSQGRRIRVKIDCYLLYLIVIKSDCKRNC